MNANISASICTQLLALIKTEIGENSYELWFKPIRISPQGENSIEIEVPNKFFEEWLITHYGELIKQSLRQIAHKDINLTFKVGPPNTEEFSSATTTEKNLKSPREKPWYPESGGRKSHVKLSSKFTFETFVIGPSNRFAYAAALAVSESPAKAYNPLFIYGGVGLGKTHLLQAIVNAISQKNKDATIMYFTSEEFTNQLINSIQNRKMV
jgi:chromosomal replication initiator protein